MAKAELLFDYARYESILADRGMTTYRVAKDAGIAYATLAMWKAGRNEIRYETALKVAKALDCKVEDFFRRDDDGTDLERDEQPARVFL